MIPGQLVPGPGRAWVGRGVAFSAKKAQRRGTLVVAWADGQKHPWVVLTDLRLNGSARADTACASGWTPARWMNENAHRDLTRADIAAQAMISTRTLNRRFRAQTGATPLH